MTSERRAMRAEATRAPPAARTRHANPGPAPPRDARPAGPRTGRLANGRRTGRLMTGRMTGRMKDRMTVRTTGRMAGHMADRRTGRRPDRKADLGAGRGIVRRAPSTSARRARPTPGPRQVSTTGRPVARGCRPAHGHPRRAW